MGNRLICIESAGRNRHDQNDRQNELPIKQQSCNNNNNNANDNREREKGPWGEWAMGGNSWKH